ncbi:MAG: response regulator [Phycisphaerae bacterium]
MSRSGGHGSAVRAPEAQLNLVLDRLDAQDPDVAAESSAADRPRIYRRRSVLLELTASAGLMQSARVMTRVLDRQLVKFLHGGFVHCGQRARLHLPRDPTLCHPVDGVIAACRHITGRIHECSLRLDRPIELAIFVPDATRRAALVIDDETTTHAFVERCLARLNIDVTTAHGGAAGLVALKQAAFDIVLLDLDMPEMDGFATLKALREQGFAGCVAAITAMTEPDISSRSLDAGFDLFIAKPLAPEALRVLVQTAVKKQPLFGSGSVS